MPLVGRDNGVEGLVPRQRRTRIVDQDLKEVTKSFEHPLEAAMEAIVAAHEDRLKRGDAKKRKGVLEAVEQIIQTCPQTRSAPDLPVPEGATA